MPNTIEVPISLIKAGDMDAIRELLPKPNLFGRWAEHPEYGRGIIISARLDPNGEVWFAHEKEGLFSGTDWDCIAPEDLTLDPVEPAHPEFLEIEADYEIAPEGTIIAMEGILPWSKYMSVWSSTLTDWGESAKDAKGMAGLRRQVLRWGWGE